MFILIFSFSSRMMRAPGSGAILLSIFICFHRFPSVFHRFSSVFHRFSLSFDCVCDWFWFMLTHSSVEPGEPQPEPKPEPEPEPEQANQMLAAPTIGTTFQWKNHHFMLKKLRFLLKNPRFLLKNLHFLLKNDDGFCIKKMNYVLKWWFLYENDGFSTAGVDKITAAVWFPRDFLSIFLSIFDWFCDSFATDSCRFRA